MPEASENPHPPNTTAAQAAASVEDFHANLDGVYKRIAQACARSGRDPEDVRLLPVSKTVPEDRIRMAYAAGCRFLGENKVQETLEKSDALADLTDLKWSVIGHLQSNKAKYVARFAHEFQALDSLKLAGALDRRLQIEGRALDVFVQVNSSGEDRKFGLPPEGVLEFVRQLPAFSALNVRGLMTLALFSPDEDRVRPCFRRMRDLQEKLRQDAPAGLSFNELSMGMSGDFELAIEEGATVVRVGQAIFGPRKIPDSHYWPGTG